MKGWSNRTLGILLACAMLTIAVGAMAYRKLGDFPKTAPVPVAPAR